MTTKKELDDALSKVEQACVLLRLNTIQKRILGYMLGQMLAANKNAQAIGQIAKEMADTSMEDMGMPPIQKDDTSIR